MTKYQSSLLLLITTLLLTSCWGPNEETPEPEKPQKLAFQLASANDITALIKNGEAVKLTTTDIAPLYALTVIPEAIGGFTPQIFDTEGKSVAEELYTFTLAVAADTNSYIGSFSFSQVGTYTAIISVVTNNASYTESSDTVVFSVGTLPVLDEASNTAETVAIKNGLPLSLVVSLLDPAAVYSYQWVKDSTDLIGETSKTLKYITTTLADSGVYYCKVTNDWGTVESSRKTVVITEENPPVWEPIPAQAVQVGKVLTLNLADYCGADEGKTITYDFDTENSSLKTATLTGTTITYTAVAEDLGPQTIAIIAAVGEAKAPVTINVTVTQNQAPVWVEVPDQAINEGAEFILDLKDYCSDPEGKALSLEVDANASTLKEAVVNGTTLSYTAKFTDAGAHTITVIANDGEVTASKVINVTIHNENRPPVWSATEVAFELAEGESKTVDLTGLCIDPDGEAVVLSLAEGSWAKAVFNETKTGFTVTTAQGEAGNYEVTVLGTDTSGLFAAQKFTFKVGDVPSIPSWNKEILTPDTIPEGETLTYDLADEVTNFDGKENLVYKIESPAIAGLTLDGSKLIKTSDFTSAGTFEITVSVTDGIIEKPLTITVIIVINDVNRKPVWSSLNTIPVAEGDTKTLDLQPLCPDPDEGDVVTFALDPGNTLDWATIPDGRNLVLKPGFGSAETYTLTVIANDTKSTSLNTFEIKVSSTLTKPEFKGLDPIDTPEDTPVTLTVDKLTIEDADGGTEFTLQVLEGDGYTVDNNTVSTPANWNGILKVNAIVKDASETPSDPFQITVTVTPENDAPVITAQPNAISTIEDTPITLTAAMFTIADPDSGNVFTLEVQAPAEGANYTVDGTKITPTLNFNGELTIPVKVNDSKALSGIFNAIITVTGETDAPVISGAGDQVLTVAEDASLVIDPAKLEIRDAEGSTTFTITLEGDDNCTVDGTTVTPNPNYNGPLSVKVTAKAEGKDVPSQPYALAITVTPENDKPEITEHQSISVNEDESVTLTTDYFTIIDTLDGETEFTLVTLPGENYTVENNVVTPAKDFNGTLNVQVQAKDKEELSDVYNFTIEVKSVNGIPEITGVKNPLSVDEDSQIELTPAMFNIVDEDDTEFTLLVTASDNYTVPSGTIVKPNPNFNGTIQVLIKAKDALDFSATFNCEITVNAINDTPEWTGSIPALSVDEGGTKEVVLTTYGKDEDGKYWFKPGAQAPGWIVVDSATNKLILNPGFTDAGTHQIPVVLTDGIIEVLQTVTVTVNNINRKPKLILPAMLEVGIGNDSTITAVIEDPDTDDNWVISTNDPEFTINGTSITWNVPITAVYNKLGNIDFYISDGEITDTTSMRIKVVKHTWKEYNLGFDSICHIVAKDDKTVYTITPDNMFTTIQDGELVSSQRISVTTSFRSWQGDARVVNDLVYAGYGFFPGKGYWTVDLNNIEEIEPKRYGSYRGGRKIAVANEGNHLFFASHTQAPVPDAVREFKLIDSAIGSSNPSPTGFEFSTNSLQPIDAAYNGVNIFACSESGIWQKKNMLATWEKIEQIPYSYVEVADNNGDVCYFLPGEGYGNEIIKMSEINNGRKRITGLKIDALSIHSISADVVWYVKPDGKLGFTSNQFTNVIEENIPGTISKVIISEDRTSTYVLTTDNKFYQY